MNEIERFYDEEYDEWDRLDRHFVEFALTKRYMDEYLAEYMERAGKKSLKILDIGGGPGRYSLYLAGKGHQVILLDLSLRNVETAKKKAAEYGITLAGAVKGNALDLEGLDTDFDVVLLMGPLYHLIEEKDRKLAVEQTLRHLMAGGLLFSSFISAFAPLQECFGYLKDVNICSGEDDYRTLLGYLKDGRNVEDGNAIGGFTTAYFTGIDEAKKLMASFSLKELAFAGAESILACKEREVQELSAENKEAWLEVAYRLSRNEYLLGTSMHFLYIGEKEI